MWSEHEIPLWSHTFFTVSTNLRTSENKKEPQTCENQHETEGWKWRKGSSALQREPSWEIAVLLGKGGLSGKWPYLFLQSHSTLFHLSPFPCSLSPTGQHQHQAGKHHVSHALCRTPLHFSSRCLFIGPDFLEGRRCCRTLRWRSARIFHDTTCEFLECIWCSWSTEKSGVTSSVIYCPSFSLHSFVLASCFLSRSLLVPSSCCSTAKKKIFVCLLALLFRPTSCVSF